MRMGEVCQWSTCSQRENIVCYRSACPRKGRKINGHKLSLQYFINRLYYIHQSIGGHYDNILIHTTHTIIKDMSLCRRTKRYRVYRNKGSVVRVYPLQVENIREIDRDKSQARERMGERGLIIKSDIFCPCK